ncbi:MAG: DHH family phosphoesterase [Deltaproteobacteria bacterium]|nr:DHH family phosphoesterase [Deltaproteobacteria bacterium]
MTDLKRGAELLVAARRVLVTCHLAPDGDATGSMSALAALLREQGRAVTVYNPDPIPRALRFLPHVGRIVHSLPHDARFDLTIVLDCGDRKLLGDKFPPAEVTGPLLVLDHHASASPFGDMYACDPAAASVGVLIARLAKILGWALSRESAPGIYTSLVADTGSFRYANTNAEALRLAADLVSVHGVDPWAIAEQLGERASLSKYRLLAAALSSMTLELQGRVAVMVVTDAMVKQASATWEDTEGLVNYARAIDGVEVGMLLSPAREGGVRVSLRSKGHKVDAGATCAKLGGGGHRGAAGCRVNAILDEVRQEMLAHLAQALA